MQLRNTLMALLCLPLYVCAQRPLHIGDTVPDVVLAPVVNYPSTTMRLSDFRGKLVILDFWATWCGSCQHAFPKLDSLQALIGDQVQFVLVNSTETADDTAKVKSFYHKWQLRTGKELSLPGIVKDTLLSKFFPHQLIPHYAWIDREGRVVAVSSSHQVSAANIRAALAGRPPGFAMKKDQNTDRPIFTNPDLPLDSLVHYSIFIKGWFEGLPGGNALRKKGDTIYGRAMMNSSLEEMYGIAARQVDPTLHPKQVVVELADSSDFMPPPRDSGGRSGWYRQHAYSLEVVVPPPQADSLYYRVLELLNRCCGYKGSFEERRQPCWVVVKKSSAVRFQSKGGVTENHLRDKSRPYLKSGTIQMLADYLNNLPLFSDMVVEGTGYEGAVDLAFNEGFDDLPAVMRNLARVGLELRREERMMKVFVVRKE